MPFPLYKSIKLLASPIFIVDVDNDSVSRWSEASKGWIGVAAAAADAIRVTRAGAAASACVAVRHHRVVFKVDVGDDARSHRRRRRQSSSVVDSTGSTPGAEDRIPDQGKASQRRYRQQSG